jgi:hypothetical protein
MAEKKTKAIKLEAPKTASEEPAKVSFLVWFSRQVKAGKLGAWQAKELSVFFRQKGLSDNERADKYSELLKLY